jgi:16S rRNA processing protein RimM
MVLVGRIAGAWGIRGWVRIHSYTEPVAGILRYSPWWLVLEGSRRLAVVQEQREQNGGVLVRLEACTDRNEAEGLVGAAIEVPESCLAPLPDGEYYWRQLVGMRVDNLQGEPLGTVRELFATGANDVLVVESVEGIQRLIPWVAGRVVRAVDPAGRRIEVDWQLDW